MTEKQVKSGNFVTLWLYENVTEGWWIDHKTLKSKSYTDQWLTKDDKLYGNETDG